MKNKRILIIAQTPPPLHGQSIMQQYLVNVDWHWCTKEFVRMNFSDSIQEVGKLKIKKILQLFDLINRVRKKSKPKFELVYYPPGGPNRIPIYRDIFILYFLKFFSQKIILHFHAGGIDQIFDKVSKIESSLIRRAFKNADALIVLSESLKGEVKWCKSEKIFVIPNGIEDVFNNFPKVEKNGKPVSFLFVGNLKKEKGIFTLLNSAMILKKQGEKFQIKFIGSFHHKEEEEQFFKFIDDNFLNQQVQFLGIKTGNEKWEQFKNADVFCLPTYETEAMPISILEAMMFEMPVITTNWRSIPDIIKHEENGLLFEPQDKKQLAECMKRMIHEEYNRHQMGAQARKDFLENFTIECHLKKIENVFSEILSA